MASVLTFSWLFVFDRLHISDNYLWGALVVLCLTAFSLYVTLFFSLKRLADATPELRFVLGDDELWFFFSVPPPNHPRVYQLPLRLSQVPTASEALPAASQDLLATSVALRAAFQAHPTPSMALSAFSEALPASSEAKLTMPHLY